MSETRKAVILDRLGLALATTKPLTIRDEYENERKSASGALAAAPSGARWRINADIWRVLGYHTAHDFQALLAGRVPGAPYYILKQRMGDDSSVGCIIVRESDRSKLDEFKRDNQRWTWRSAFICFIPDADFEAWRAAKGELSALQASEASLHLLDPNDGTEKIAKKMDNTAFWLPITKGTARKDGDIRKNS